jgi:hypothetical protein
MRRNYRVMLSAAVFSIGLLAGCSELSIKTDEVVEKSMDGAVAISDTADKAALSWIKQAKADGLNKEISTTHEIGSASVLQIENTVGNIEVKAGAGDKVTMSASIWSMKNKTNYQQILDQAEVSVIVNGDHLEILTHPKNNSKQNLWKWAEDKYGLAEFSIDYIVELPVTVNSYEVSNHLGEISLHNLKGSYQVINDVGAINIDGAHIFGKSSVKSEAGNLNLGINQMDRDSSLNVKTEVGSIQATLQESLQCNLETKSELGQITGAPQGESEMNGGGPLLSLASTVGSIVVEKT